MSPSPSKSTALTALPLVLVPSASWAQSTIIDGWTDLALSASRMVIVFASLLGILYAASSLWRAYHADLDDTRARHLFAALFAGMFTIIGVVIGAVSGLLIP